MTPTWRSQKQGVDKYKIHGIYFAYSLGLIFPRGQSVTTPKWIGRKWIDLEGLGKRRTGTRREFTYVGLTRCGFCLKWVEILFSLLWHVWSWIEILVNDKSKRTTALKPSVQCLYSIVEKALYFEYSSRSMDWKESLMQVKRAER